MKKLLVYAFISYELTLKNCRQRPAQYFQKEAWKSKSPADFCVMGNVTPYVFSTQCLSGKAKVKPGRKEWRQTEMGALLINMLFFLAFKHPRRWSKLYTEVVMSPASAAEPKVRHDGNHRHRETEGSYRMCDVLELRSDRCGALKMQTVSSKTIMKSANQRELIQPRLQSEIIQHSGKGWGQAKSLAVQALILRAHGKPGTVCV